MDTHTESKSAEQLTGSSGLGLLDFVEMLAEKFWLLLLAPFVGAGIALIVANFIPKSYTSVAHVSLNDDMVRLARAYFATPLVLDKILEKFPEKENSQDSARQSVSRKIRVVERMEGAKKVGGLTLLEVDSEDPKRAQATNALLIETWLELRKPRAAEKKEIEQQLQRSEEQYVAVSALSGRLEKEATNLLMPNSMNGEVATALTSLLGQKDKHADAIAKFKTLLRGMERDVVFSEPTLPTDPTWPKTDIFAKIGGGIGFAFAMLLAMVSGLLRRATNDTQTKVRHISELLTFSGRNK